MNYSPSSVREIVGVTQETLRHWRRVLQPLTKRQGRQSFSANDLLVLSIIKELTTTFKLQINGVAPIALILFDVCNPINWDSYRDKYLAINFMQQKVELLSQNVALSELTTPVILIDINKHIANLRKKLLESNEVYQLELYFPPKLIGHSAS